MLILADFIASGSGSRKTKQVPVYADPDPEHSNNVLFFSFTSRIRILCAGASSKSFTSEVAIVPSVIDWVSDPMHLQNRTESDPDRAN